MSEQHQLRLLLNDFRAVKQADIIIDGITVVAGENGSGKSTISKFLYHLMNDLFDYKNYIYQLFFDELNNINKNLNVAIKFLKKISDNQYIEFPSHLEPYVGKNFFGYHTIEYSHSFESKIDVVLTKIKSIKEFIEKKLYDIVATKEYGKFLQRIKLISSLNQNENNVIKHLNRLNENVIRLKKDFNFYIENPPVDIFINRLIKRNNVANIQIQLYEQGLGIFEYDNNFVNELLFFNKVIYIESPFILDYVDKNYKITNIDYNSYLFDLLREKEDSEFDLTYNFEIDKIINGEVQYDKLGKFKYKRTDGSEFDIFDCATGLKSFAILNLLLRNNHLTNKTLLIIDEPEAHLHPQWIVEYARLIVLLNKELGVKFFIASHNPDMISALKYIAKKEGNISNLNFYLSTKQANEYTYTFTHLKDDIEPIFKEFNIALDRMEQYGDTSL